MVWFDHINGIFSGISKRCGILRRVKYFVIRDTLRAHNCQKYKKSRFFTCSHHYHKNVWIEGVGLKSILLELRFF